MNELEVSPKLASRRCALQALLTTLETITFETQVLFVDDGSRDLIRDLIREKNSIVYRMRGLKLSSNLGHHSALIAAPIGVEGDAVLSIDADLQDNPNVIEAIVDEARAGQDVMSLAVVSIFRDASLPV